MFLRAAYVASQPHGQPRPHFNPRRIFPREAFRDWEYQLSSHVVGVTVRHVQYAVTIWKSPVDRGHYLGGFRTPERARQAAHDWIAQQQSLEAAQRAARAARS
jgi:plasmid stabilization system protein ParE